VVRVNKKPQHLVFCLHSPHQPAKYRTFSVESSKNPRLAHTQAFQICPKSDATKAFPSSHPASPNLLPRPRLPYPKIKPSPAPVLPQDARTVQFPRTPVRSVDICDSFQAAPHSFGRQTRPRRLNSCPHPAPKDTMRPRALRTGPHRGFPIRQSGDKQFLNPAIPASAGMARH
jgi:hypothetical protein